MRRESVVVASALGLLALACGSTEPTPIDSSLPQCCVDRASGFRSDVDQVTCEATDGASWVASVDCAAVCCVTDGKGTRRPAGQCKGAGATAAEAACAPGAVIPPVCCTDRGKFLPTDANECAPKLTHRTTAEPRRGEGHLVAEAACETVCCEHADYTVDTTLRGACAGNVVPRDPCVIEYPATRVCCQTRYDTTGATVTRLAWSADGSCGGGLSDGKVLADAGCAGLAYGEADEDWDVDPEFRDAVPGE